MIIQCGRRIETDEIELIKETVQTFWRLSRTELARTVCELLNWQTASGSCKVDACMKLLSRLETRNIIKLPDKRRCCRGLQKQNSSADGIASEIIQTHEPIICMLSDIRPVKLRVVKSSEEINLFNKYMSRYHYLGCSKPFGCYLRIFIEGSGTILGAMLFAGAARAVRARDEWIGWNKNIRLRNLGYVVGNGRFVIFPWVRVKHLASHALGMATRDLSRLWQQRWNYRPALLETFVDPRYFEGICYRAANFQYLGMTDGKGLFRQGRQNAVSPKKIFVYPLADDFRQILCSVIDGEN